MSHSIKVIAGGFALLILCLLIGRVIGVSDGRTTVAHAALFFIPLWLVGAGVNMWLGVSRAGYSVKEETPILFDVFLIPAVVALLVWWSFSRQ